MRLATLPQAIKEFRLIDPRTALNETMLLTLIRKNQLPYGNHGVRTVVDIRLVIATLNELLGFTDETFLPQIRTIRTAAAELKKVTEHIVMGEDRIRICVADGKIPSILIGNRRYIALQSFTDPYSQSIVCGKVPGMIKKELLKCDMLEQLGAKISRNTVPQVVRIKSQK
ncbi:MAG: hypothetical protein DBY04_00885 [Clostridiales bacterium]|nr:MAG: hypothetical protein DBY04_00885 [Clostridiales bacterium]